jgi:hypothetical protein
MTKTKCSGRRGTCKTNSADPENDLDWTWIGFLSFSELGFRTGWWCSKCCGEIQPILNKYGMPISREPVH